MIGGTTCSVMFQIQQGDTLKYLVPPPNPRGKGNALSRRTNGRRAKRGRAPADGWEADLGAPEGGGKGDLGAPAVNRKLDPGAPAVRGEVEPGAPVIRGEVEATDRGARLPGRVSGGTQARAVNIHNRTTRKFSSLIFRRIACLKIPLG